jgi:hypothetical protein
MSAGFVCASRILRGKAALLPYDYIPHTVTPRAAPHRFSNDLLPEFYLGHALLFAVLIER